MKFDWRRARLLAIIKKHQPISVAACAREAGISGGTTIYRQLKELKSLGLITMDRRTKEKNQPTILRTTHKADPLDLKAFEAIDKLKALFGSK